ncbi:MAG: electron transfer flavoprotein subunit beta/FixA family protein [Bacteroidia bacterium]|nr:electron transfer flavoprotein subunit beta/FixA family protein [Bacteroidia bacterium]MDW8158568.1 electron transfer flavoprotein subunit beta/FixA family protein [Bacteroidia bacterium]
MNTLICIGHVPDTTTKIQLTPDGKQINKEGVTFIIGPYEEYAISRALELKEGGIPGKVSVICVGGPKADETLRKALAIGADEAFRIDTESTDSFFIAHQLASFIKENPFDLIMMGKESIDRNASEVPGMVAELVGVPCVTFCSFLEVNNGKATVRREVDGQVELLEVPLPAIITAQKGFAEWRIANMRGIMAARTKPLKVIPAKEVEEKTYVVGYELPSAKKSCTFIQPENVGQIVNILAERGIL